MAISRIWQGALPRETLGRCAVFLEVLTSSEVRTPKHCICES
jgi:hypothetical protein